MFDEETHLENYLKIVIRKRILCTHCGYKVWLKVYLVSHIITKHFQYKLVVSLKYVKFGESK